MVNARSFEFAIVPSLFTSVCWVALFIPSFSFTMTKARKYETHSIKAVATLETSISPTVVF
jgi:hypothetical protein